MKQNQWKSPTVQPQPSTASSSSSSCSLPKAKSSLESLSKSKLSWPVRVQKTLYTMATCCVKCLGPVWYEKNWFFTKNLLRKGSCWKATKKKSDFLTDHLENNLFTILFWKRQFYQILVFIYKCQKYDMNSTIQMCCALSIKPNFRRNVILKVWQKCWIVRKSHFEKKIRHYYWPPKSPAKIKILSPRRACFQKVSQNW